MATQSISQKKNLLECSKIFYLLELFNGPFIDSSAFVNQVTSSGRFTGVDVADDDDVNVSLLFRGHLCSLRALKQKRFKNCNDFVKFTQKNNKERK